MAISEEKRTQLKKALQKCDQLERLTAGYLRDGNEEMAQKAVSKKLEVEGEIEKLTRDYEEQRKQADGLYEAYQNQAKELKADIGALPELKQDVKMIESQEKIQKNLSNLNIDGAKSKFDDTVKTIEARKKALQLQAKIEDPGVDEIERALKEEDATLKITSEVDRIRALVDKSDGAIDVDFEVVEEGNPRERARALLSSKPSFDDQ
jgi:phage shock protein A